MTEPRSEAETLALNISGLNHEQVTDVLQKLMDELSAAQENCDRCNARLDPLTDENAALRRRAEAAEVKLAALWREVREWFDAVDGPKPTPDQWGELAGILDSFEVKS